MPKFIVLNGPPKSGKDTIGQALYAELTFRGVKVKREKFASPIKDAVAAFLGLTEVERTMYFENPEVKDHPSRVFFNKTPRQVLISFSEDWVKQKFGAEAFGYLLKLRTEDLPDDYIVVTDCGFDVELNPFDVTDIAVVRLHRDGCSYKNDSRGYITRDDIFSFDVKNNNEPEHIAQAILWKLNQEGFMTNV